MTKRSGVAMPGAKLRIVVIALLMVTICTFAPQFTSAAGASTRVKDAQPTQVMDLGDLTLTSAMSEATRPAPMDDAIGIVSVPSSVVVLGQPAPEPVEENLPLPGEEMTPEEAQQLRQLTGEQRETYECRILARSEVDSQFGGGVASVLGYEEARTNACLSPATPVAAGALSAAGTCIVAGVTGDEEECENGFASEVVSEVGEDVFKDIIESLYRGFIGMMQAVLEYTFGSENEGLNPVVDCDAGVLEREACTGWFGGQLSLMSQVGLWTVLPLLALVAIQAVVHGSMFMLLRAGLILLPVAILGSAVLTTIVQLLLDIADQFCDWMIALLGSEERAGQQAEALGELIVGNPESAVGLGFFTAIFFVFGLLGSLVIMIWLLIREVGIYLSVLFLPLCFAALVWPASAKWARRLVEILIALIFSKVFILAALSLGLASLSDFTALASDPAAQGVAGEEAGGAQLGQITEQQLEVLGALGTAVVMIVLTAILPSKLVSFIPGGDQVTSGQIGRPGNVTSRMEGLNYYTGKLASASRGASARAGAPSSTRGGMRKPGST